VRRTPGRAGPALTRADQEAHGGVYALHSHVNHSCAPRVSARHLDQRGAIARLSVLARAPLAPGDELTLTYVDPTRDVRARRRELAQWGFGACACDRCVAEEAELRAQGKWTAEEDDGREDMEKELKGGLGLM
jgi:hypothetical protein